MSMIEILRLLHWVRSQDHWHTIDLSVTYCLVCTHLVVGVWAPQIVLHSTHPETSCISSHRVEFYTPIGCPSATRCDFADSTYIKTHLPQEEPCRTVWHGTSLEQFWTVATDVEACIGRPMWDSEVLVRGHLIVHWWGPRMHCEPWLIWMYERVIHQWSGIILRGIPSGTLFVSLHYCRAPSSSAMLS